VRELLLEEVKSLLSEAGLSVAEHEDALVLIIEEEGKEVAVYMMADEEKKLVYVMASANPPITLRSATDLLKVSWEIVDRGVPCKISLNEDIVLIEHDLDECHLSKESLLESIYFSVESMLYLMERLFRKP
jgi:hypothetical protein